MILPREILANEKEEELSRHIRKALEKMDRNKLPLQQGLSGSSVALDDELQVVMLSTRVEKDAIEARAGLFYTGVIAGCSCADDPTPMDRVNEYCEIDIRINRETGEARISLHPN